jgi:flagellar biosynthesis protein FliR
VVVLFLIADIVVGTIMVRSHPEIWIWGGVVFSLSVMAGLLILACVLIAMMGRIRMDE